MRVVRAAGQNVSPSDDGRLFDQIFSDGLFTDTTFTNLGGNSVQVGAMYGDLCGRDFTIEQMTLTVTLPEGEGEVTGYIYVEIDTSSDDVITLNSALAPFTPTYEDINTNGAIAQMILAEYTATAVAVTGVTPVYERAAASAVKAGSIATVESAQATQNHAVGDYVLLNGQLYVVTAAVNTGETFVEGTNISAAVIGDALTALNNGLTPSWEDIGVNIPEGTAAQTLTNGRTVVPAIKFTIANFYGMYTRGTLSVGTQYKIGTSGYKPKCDVGVDINRTDGGMACGTLVLKTNGEIYIYPLETIPSGVNLRAIMPYFYV